MHMDVIMFSAVNSLQAAIGLTLCARYASANAKSPINCAGVTEGAGIVSHSNMVLYGCYVYIHTYAETNSHTRPFMVIHNTSK